MQLKKHYKTIILSDLHLGMPHAKVNELIQFLRSVSLLTGGTYTSIQSALGEVTLCVCSVPYRR